LTGRVTKVAHFERKWRAEISVPRRNVPSLL
jgi:hypothetical protein